MNLIETITSYVSALLANRPALAVIIGLVFSLAFTQWLKFVLLHVDWLPDPKRWIVRAVALPIGAVATYVAFPDGTPTEVRALVGVAVGAVAPYVYQVATAIIGRFFPEVQARLSVDPYGELDK